MNFHCDTALLHRLWPSLVPRLDPGLMFQDVFSEMPEHLRRQEAEMRRELAEK